MSKVEMADPSVIQVCLEQIQSLACGLKNRSSPEIRARRSNTRRYRRLKWFVILSNIFNHGNRTVNLGTEHNHEVLAVVIQCTGHATCTKTIDGGGHRTGALLLRGRLARKPGLAQVFG